MPTNWRVAPLNLPSVTSATMRSPRPTIAEVIDSISGIPAMTTSPGCTSPSYTAASEAAPSRKTRRRTGLLFRAGELHHRAVRCADEEMQQPLPGLNG